MWTMKQWKRNMLLLGFVGFLAASFYFAADLVPANLTTRWNDANQSAREDSDQQQLLTTRQQPLTTPRQQPPTTATSFLSNLEARRTEWQKYAKLSEGKPKRKRVPDVVGIGVKKCGTDALITFLKHHPFVKAPGSANVEAMYFNKRYGKGLDFYRSMMPNVADHELVMEKTPKYFDSPPITVPDRIKKDLPNAKLILVLCDPVNRSFSDYTHEWAKIKLFGPGAGLVRKYKTFDSYLDVYLDRARAYLNRNNKENLQKYMQECHADPDSTVLTTGFYSVFLQRWTALFDSKQLLILNGEDLLNDPGAQVERLQEFLGIPKILLADDFVRSPVTGLFCVRPWWRDYSFENERSRAPDWHKQLACLADTKGRTRHSNGSLTVSEKHLASLRDLYKPFNDELYRMTGIRYGK